MYVIRRTLGLRHQHPELFSHGEYLPLSVEGEKTDHVVAFARKLRNVVAVVIAPRLVAGLLGNSDQAPIGRQVWGDTRVLVPDANSFNSYQNVFSGEQQAFHRGDSHSSIDLPTALRDFPVGLFLLK